MEFLPVRENEGGDREERQELKKEETKGPRFYYYVVLYYYSDLVSFFDKFAGNLTRIFNKGFNWIERF